MTSSPVVGIMDIYSSQDQTGKIALVHIGLNRQRQNEDA
jgi:hypothetical protein